MEDFLNQFKENLENRPEPEYEKRDWQVLQKRLDKQGRTRPAFVWWWAALPLFLLLLSSNMVFYQGLKNANKKISVLQNQYTKYIHQTDTVFISKIIYQTDTVYLTRTVIQYIGGTLENRFDQPMISPIGGVYKNNGMLKSDEIEIDNSISSILDSGDKSNQVKNENNDFNKESTDFILEKLGVPEIPYLISENKVLPNLAVENAVSGKKKTLCHYLYAMQPKDFQMGVTAGPVVPFSLGLKPLVSFTAGAEALVGFNPKVQMWANANYSKLRFSSKTMNEDKGIPIIPFPNPNDLFLDAELPLNSLQFSFGMQYVLNVSKKYKPFFGAGIGASSLLPYQITYNFVDQITGEETIREREMNGGGLTTGLLFIRTGLTHDISKKYKFKMHIEYRHNLNGSDFYVPNAFGVQGSIFYRFK